MKKTAKIFILCALLLITFSGIVSRAAISKPKNFRIVYKNEKGTELESFEWSVYAVQQVFLDKLNVRTYIDPKGYEYKVTGYRLKTWPGANYTGKASDDVSMNYNGIVAELRKAYDTLDTPYSLQATIVLKATGNKYSPNIPVHIIWLNQDSEFVKEEIEYLGRDGIYTDKPPKDYEIISVDAMMTDIWKVGSEITINKKSPTVRYNQFAEEYKIVYRLKLTKEEEAEIMGLVPGSTEAQTGESGSSANTETADTGTETVQETTAAPPSSEAGSSTAAHTLTDPAETETPVLPTQTDESFKTGSGRTTLIIGLVIGIGVIYLIVITIGTSSRKNKTRRKNRL